MKNTQDRFNNDYSLDSFTAEIKYEDPNPMIYQFQGILKFSQQSHALSAEQFLLRGSSLKNTN